MRIYTSNIKVELVNSKIRPVDVVSFGAVDVTNKAKGEIICKISVVKRVH